MLKTDTLNTSKRNRGTALIVALAVMFALGILGLVFIRLVSFSSLGAQVGGERTASDELATAGVRYAFSQLRFSEDGADWRPQPPIDVNDNLPGLTPDYDPENPAATNPDPDYYWLKRGDPNNPNDRGGPDGLGYFSRINFRNGRALIRVRYEPSGIELFATDAITGNLITDRGMMRAYTLIDSVGRPGAINVNDPTMVRNPDLQNARQISAVATIGIIESGRYITNKSKLQQPVELGVPSDFGGTFAGNPVNIPVILGGARVAPPPGYSSPNGGLTTGCPIYINGSLQVYGDLQVFLHRSLGDQINIHGSLSFADPDSSLTIGQISEVNGNEVINTFSALPSLSPSFSTFGGILRDLGELPDSFGYPRSTPYKDPPLVDDEDPATGQQRYRSATANSGTIALDFNGNEFNLGRLGYGRGVWVSNYGDLQGDSEDGDFTLRFDWLNPNNGHGSSNWDGPFYNPDVAYIMLVPDGFIIRRSNADGPRGLWQNYNRTNSGKQTLRFKLGFGSDGTLRIINELTPGVTNFWSPTAADFNNGPQFNGLVCFEGDVRVRGVIPSNTQLTITSMGNIYVEGSIVKGTSTSTLALLAKQNLVLNTTQILGRSPFRPFVPAVADTFTRNNPWRLPVTTTNPLYLSVQFAETLGSYTYSGLNDFAPALFVAHAAEFESQTFVNLLINEGFNSNPPGYYFPPQYPPNAASKYVFPPMPSLPIYGLDIPGVQVLPDYEKRSFRIWPISGIGLGGNGGYQFFFNALENELQIKKDGTIAPPGGNSDYYLARAAIQPLDVRIEAVMYAQEGSFFVIPGPWFNWNPNDRRDNFVNAATRQQQHNATVEFPFYGEPLDIRINIIGSVSENFPPQIADQGEWLRKWGWIPREYGASNNFIPDQHVPTGYPYNWDSNSQYVPNLFINYDPILISGRLQGSFSPSDPPIRTDAFGRTLPPMPKLPIGTKLFYIGEVNPR